MQKTALISIRSFVIYITRISTYYASYYSNTPSHLNNFSCVDVNKMYNMTFNPCQSSPILFIERVKDLEVDSKELTMMIMSVKQTQRNNLKNRLKTFLITLN